MNSPRTIAYGWAAFIVAGFAGYYVTKKEINAQRRTHTVPSIKPLEELTWQERVARDEEALRQRLEQQQHKQTPSASSS
ncbi:hypothetical protein BCR44DRAFT_47498 [Catenaria anguillulae PL171]|uniref:Uncharacterized protein n=1 Tax=Catenaria anguillulae PL171 TaxID=765915 RepID=A0A1Y2HUN5_9FUNG|nr:hypothetical protein BCR44DRAFT_47498 [Catenaria anguillulae PL171]